MNIKNILKDIPKERDGEIVQELVRLNGARIERIVSRGHASPGDFWYDQDEHEWVLVLSGRAGISFAGEDAVLTLEPGDYLNIPAHTRHRVEWTDPGRDTVWLAVYYR